MDTVHPSAEYRGAPDAHTRNSLSLCKWIIHTVNNVLTNQCKNKLLSMSRLCSASNTAEYAERFFRLFSGSTLCTELEFSCWPHSATLKS